MQSNSQMKQFAAHKACFRNAGPALRTALEYLLGGSYRDSIDEKGQVPPFNTLAKWAGVSRDSMLKAAKLLRDAGFFAGIRGQRYRFISVATATKSPPNNASGRAAESIRADLLNGIYAPGAHLPSVKQLQWKYNV